MLEGETDQLFSLLVVAACQTNTSSFLSYWTMKQFPGQCHHISKSLSSIDWHFVVYQPQSKALLWIYKEKVLMVNYKVSVE